MHLHKFEKIWLMFGGGMIAVFLGIIGFGAFVNGSTPPGHQHMVDPATVPRLSTSRD